MDRLQAEFDAICRCGGRLSGTESERRAVALLKALGRAATGVDARVETVTYGGWRATASELTGPDGANHPLKPLVRSAASPPGGVEAEVLDLGRGTPEEFDAHRTEIPGRIVLVRHELMFAPGTIHRRIKYRAAVEAGAVGFLDRRPRTGKSWWPGSSGRRDEPGIPAAGVTPETARAFRRTVRGRTARAAADFHPKKRPRASRTCSSTSRDPPPDTWCCRPTSTATIWARARSTTPPVWPSPSRWSAGSPRTRGRGAGDSGLPSSTSRNGR